MTGRRDPAVMADHEIGTEILALLAYIEKCEQFSIPVNPRDTQRIADLRAQRTRTTAMRQ